MKRHLKILYGRLIRALYQIIYWMLCNTPFFKLYQPVFGHEGDNTLTRDCEDRWAVFSEHLPKEKGSLLDIGCNIGYFSFKSAELGHRAFGIESDHFNITSCNAIKAATASDNALFMKNLIDPEFVKTMPSLCR